LSSPEGDLPPAHLSYLDLTYPEIEANLALDEALLIAAEERAAGPALRVWEAPRLAVVLGSSGRLHEEVNVDLCRAEGVAIARRSSGGGTVVIGPGALNVTLVLSADDAPGLHAVDTAQAYVLERIARSIRSLGPDVEVKGLGDLTLGDRKFSGSAQRRLRRSFLVHASILYDFPADNPRTARGAPMRRSSSTSACPGRNCSTRFATRGLHPAHSRPPLRFPMIWSVSSSRKSSATHDGSSGSDTTGTQREGPRRRSGWRALPRCAIMNGRPSARAQPARTATVAGGRGRGKRGGDSGLDGRLFWLC
jgi:lipoate-protein ligase A